MKCDVTPCTDEAVAKVRFLGQHRWYFYCARHEPPKKPTQFTEHEGVKRPPWHGAEVVRLDG